MNFNCKNGWNSFSGRFVVAAWLCTAAGLSAHGQSTQREVDFAIPDSAYHTKLGMLRPQTDVPVPRSYMVADHFSGVIDNQSASADRGIPLGGIGAGSFEINQAGSFGPWYFGGGSHEWRVLPQAAFHVREQQGSWVNIKTLAVNGIPEQRYDYVHAAKPTVYTPHVMAAWPTIAAGEADYFALYPFGWINYRAGQNGPFRSNISVRFWSPIVARDDERSSMPAGYFDIRLHNPTKSSMKISVMFTFPNAPVHVAGVSPNDWLFGRPDTHDLVGGRPSQRSEFSAKFEIDAKHKIAAVVLSANGADDTEDAKNTDWAIAAKGNGKMSVSYVTSWNASGDGRDILSAFSATGVLPNRNLDKSYSAGALAVSVDLAPGETTLVPIVLAWDFPRDVYTGGGGDPRQGASKQDKTTVWMRRYTDFFGAQEDAQNNYIAGSYKPHRGFEIADRLLQDHDRNLRDVIAWWEPIAEDKKVPSEVRKAALNQVFTYVVNSSFWEGGWVSNTVPIPGGGKRVGSDIPGTHLFSIADGGDAGDETLKNADVDPYTFLSTNLLFPSIERDYLRGLTEGVLRADPNKVGTGTVGTPPYLKVGSEGPNISHNSGYLYRCWAYYTLNHDAAFFRYAYPAMVKLYEAEKVRYSLNMQPLPAGNQTSHDLLPVYGNGVLPSTHWLLTLAVIKAANDEAVRLNLDGATDAVGKEAEHKFLEGRRALEDGLWDAKAGHYKFDTGHERVYDGGLYPEATFNQHLAEVVHLPDLMDPEHLLAHLHAIWAGSILPFKDEHGRFVGAIDLLSTDGKVFGTANPSVVKGLPFGDPPPGFKFPPFLNGTMEAREFWPGTGFDLAAVMLHDGKRFSDSGLQTDGARLATDIAFQLWDANRGYAFQAPDANAVVLNSAADPDGNIPVAVSTTTLNPYAHRNLSYARALSVWDAMVEFDPHLLRMTTEPYK